MSTTHSPTPAPQLPTHRKWSEAVARLIDDLGLAEQGGQAWLAVEEFRQQIGLADGIYPKPSDLKRRILEIAESEVPSLRPAIDGLKFEFAPNVEGSKVVKGISITVNAKPMAAPLSDTAEVTGTAHEELTEEDGEGGVVWKLGHTTPPSPSSSVAPTIDTGAFDIGATRIDLGAPEHGSAAGLADSTEADPTDESLVNPPGIPAQPVPAPAHELEASSTGVESALPAEAPDQGPRSPTPPIEGATAGEASVLPPSGPPEAIMQAGSGSHLDNQPRPGSDETDDFNTRLERMATLFSAGAGAIAAYKSEDQGDHDRADGVVHDQLSPTSPQADIGSSAIPMSEDMPTRKRGWSLRSASGVLAHIVSGSDRAQHIGSDDIGGSSTATDHEQTVIRQRPAGPPDEPDLVPFNIAEPVTPEDELLDRILELTRQCEQADREKDAAETRLTDLLREFQPGFGGIAPGDLMELIEQIGNFLNKQTMSATDYSEKIEDLSAQVDALHSSLQNENEKFQSLTNEYRELQSHLSLNEQNQSRWNTLLTSYKSELGRLRILTTRAISDTDLRGELTFVREDLETMRSALLDGKEMPETDASTRHIILELERLLAEKSKALDSCDSSLQDAVRDIDHKASHIVALEDEIRRAEEEIVRLQLRVQEQTRAAVNTLPQTEQDPPLELTERAPQTQDPELPTSPRELRAQQPGTLREQQKSDDHRDEPDDFTGEENRTTRGAMVLVGAMSFGATLAIAVLKHSSMTGLLSPLTGLLAAGVMWILHGRFGLSRRPAFFLAAGLGMASAYVGADHFLGEPSRIHITPADRPAANSADGLDPLPPAEIGAPLPQGGPPQTHPSKMVQTDDVDAIPHALETKPGGQEQLTTHTVPDPTIAPARPIPAPALVAAPNITGSSPAGGVGSTEFTDRGHVAVAQDTLRALTLFNGQTSGFLDEATRDALGALQNAAGIQRTRKLDGQTWDKIQAIRREARIQH